MPINVFAADPRSVYYAYALQPELFDVIPAREDVPTRLAIYKQFLTDDSYMVFFGDQKDRLKVLKPIPGRIIQTDDGLSSASRVRAVQGLIEKITGSWLPVHPFDLFCAYNDLLEVRPGEESPIDTRHDVIQLLFPTTKQSESGQQAILLSHLDIEKIREDASLQKTLLFDFAIMMKFLGFNFSVRDNGAGSYAMKLTAPESVPFWARGKNHNQWRITRMLRSLSLCNLRGLALMFLSALKIMRSNPDVKIPPNCYTDYWSPAIEGVKIEAALAGLPRIAVDPMSDEDRQKIIWANFSEMMQAMNGYRPEQAGLASTFFSAHKLRHDKKQEAAEALKMAITDNGSAHSGSYDYISVSKQTKEHRDIMLKVAAMARGYLRVGGEILEGNPSRLKTLLETIVSIADATLENRYCSDEARQMVLAATAVATSSL